LNLDLNKSHENCNHLGYLFKTNFTTTILIFYFGLLRLAQYLYKQKISRRAVTTRFIFECGNPGFIFIDTFCIAILCF